MLNKQRQEASDHNQKVLTYIPWFMVVENVDYYQAERLANELAYDFKYKGVPTPENVKLWYQSNSLHKKNMKS